MDASDATGLLDRLDEFGLALRHPALNTPTYLNALAGHEGDAVSTDVADLGRRLSDPWLGRANSSGADRGALFGLDAVDAAANNRVYLGAASATAGTAMALHRRTLNRVATTSVGRASLLAESGWGWRSGNSP